jgi:hypothetical protein
MLNKQIGAKDIFLNIFSSFFFAQKKTSGNHCGG